MRHQEAFEYYLNNKHMTSIAQAMHLCLDNKEKDLFWTKVKRYVLEQPSGVRLA